MSTSWDTGTSVRQSALRKLACPLSQLSYKADSTGTIKTFHMIEFCGDLPAGRFCLYKDNKDPMKLDATIPNYEEWATNIKDHLSRTNRDWSILLNFVEKQPTITITRCCRRCMWVV